MEGEEDDGNDDALSRPNAQTAESEAALMQQLAIDRLRKIADILGLGVADMLRPSMSYSLCDAANEDRRPTDARELASLFSKIDDDDSRRLLLDLARMFVTRQC